MFILAIFLTIISELFAGKICLPRLWCLGSLTRSRVFFEKRPVYKNFFNKWKKREDMAFIRWPQPCLVPSLTYRPHPRLIPQKGNVAQKFCNEKKWSACL
jgi:hypothetical protein